MFPTLFTQNFVKMGSSLCFLIVIFARVLINSCNFVFYSANSTMFREGFQKALKKIESRCQVNATSQKIIKCIFLIESSFLKAGADLGFSRGGGGGRIFKKFSKNLTTFFFFRSIRLIFRALPKQ